MFNFVEVAGKPVSACNKDEFPCNDGSCILKILWCNGELNCQDKSDEEFCFFKSNLRPGKCIYVNIAAFTFTSLKPHF